MPIFNPPPTTLTLKSMAEMESPNPTPNLLLYLSISQNNKTLFTFNPDKDPSLETLASLFLQNPPPFHSHFSHSSHSRSLAFLLDPGPPLTCFFAISPTSPNLLPLLRQIKNHFRIHGTNFDAGGFEHFFSTSSSSNSNPSSFVSMEAPLLGMGVDKKNSSSSSSSSSSLVVKIDGVEMGSNMDSNLVQKSTSFSSRSRQVGMRLWWRHVKIVVVADLFLCMVLFGIWLTVCRGFRCLS